MKVIGRTSDGRRLVQYHGGLRFEPDPDYRPQDKETIADHDQPPISSTHGIPEIPNPKEEDWL